MSDEKRKATVLQECLGKGQRLADMVEYAENSIVSKTILDKPTGTLTLFAFDRGQKLSEHTAPFDATIQVVDGKCEVTIDGINHSVSEGELIIMPKDIPHSVQGTAKFKMLLIMIR